MPLSSLRELTTVLTQGGTDMQKQNDSIDNRLVVLEEKLEYQDYTIEKLNEVIISQQSQLDTLEAQVRILNDTIGAGELERRKKGQDVPPPHY